MYAIGRFLRWLFIDPIREAVFFATLIVIASHAMAAAWLNSDNHTSTAGKGTPKGKPDEKSPPSPPPVENS